MNMQVKSKGQLQRPSTGFAFAMTELTDALAQARASNDREEKKRLEDKIARLRTHGFAKVDQAVAAEEKGDKAASIQLWREVAHTLDAPIGANACRIVALNYMLPDNPGRHEEGFATSWPPNVAAQKAQHPISPMPMRTVWGHPKTMRRPFAFLSARSNRAIPKCITESASHIGKVAGSSRAMRKPFGTFSAF